MRGEFRPGSFAPETTDIDGVSACSSGVRGHIYLLCPFVNEPIDLLSDGQGMDQWRTLADKPFQKKECSISLRCPRGCRIEEGCVRRRVPRSGAKTLRGG